MEEKTGKKFDLETILIITFVILIIVTVIILLGDKKKIYCVASASETNLTNQNLKVFVFARGDNAKVKTNVGTIIDGNYYELEVSENGIYTFASVSDNKTSECSISVENIDREKPNVSLKPSSKNRVTSLNLIISASDSKALADQPYSWDNKNWTNSEQRKIIKNGTYTAYVKDKAGNVASATYKVTNIGNPTISDSLTMEINTSVKLIADGNNVKTWKSNNSNVASVDSTGTVKTKHKGTATITAVLTNGDMYTWAINVTKSNATSITLNITDIKLKPGETANVSIKQITPSNTTCDTILWKSNNSGIAKINSGTITAVANGSAVITVSCDSVSAKVNVTVKNSENPIIPTSTSEKYESSTLKYYVQNKGNHYLTYIWMEDPYNQIKKLDANAATYGKILTDDELSGMQLKRMDVGTMVNKYIASGMISASKGLVAYNASGFYVKGSWNPPTDYFHLRSSSWFVLNEGKITRNMLNSNTENGTIIGIDSRGNLNYYSTAVDAATKAQIVNNISKDKVKNTFSFGPLLISNKTIVSGSNDSAHRQAICQIDSNNYVMLTTIRGMSLNQVATTLLDIGCQTAFNLDGGGSTTMYYKKAGSTTATKYVCRDGDTGNICRTIIEGIYFVEK